MCDCFVIFRFNCVCFYFRGRFYKFINERYVLCHIALINAFYWLLHIHGQETRDVSASFPFLNWRPPLQLIDQLAIYISWYFCVDLEANMILYRSSVADKLVLIPCIRISS